MYQPDATTRLEVRIEEENVWLTQAQIAVLFGTEVPAISKHIRNIYQSEELYRESTVSKMEIVRQEGNRLVRRNIDIYNLDMILSIGISTHSCWSFSKTGLLCSNSFATGRRRFFQRTDF